MVAACSHCYQEVIRFSLGYQEDVEKASTKRVFVDERRPGATHNSERRRPIGRQVFDNSLSSTHSGASPLKTCRPIDQIFNCCGSQQGIRGVGEWQTAKEAAGGTFAPPTTVVFIVHGKSTLAKVVTSLKDSSDLCRPQSDVMSVGRIVWVAKRSAGGDLSDFYPLD